MGDLAVQPISIYPASAGVQSTVGTGCIWAPVKKEPLAWAPGPPRILNKYFFAPLVALLLVRRQRTPPNRKLSWLLITRL